MLSRSHAILPDFVDKYDVHKRQGVGIIRVGKEVVSGTFFFKGW